MEAYPQTAPPQHPKEKQNKGARAIGKANMVGKEKVKAVEGTVSIWFQREIATLHGVPETMG